MKAAFVSLAISSGLVTSLALAQAPAPAPTQRNPAAPAAAPTSTPTPAPAPPGVATPPAAGAPTGEPTLPTIDDPMLRPPPPAAHVLTSWRQAIDLVRRRSTTLRTSLARVDQAAAIARQALSDALPQLSARGTIDRELLRSDRSTLALVGGVPTRTVEEVPDPATFLRAALDLRVPLFAPAAWSNRGSALDAVDATRLSVKETERLIIAGVADAIVIAVTAERLADVSRVSLASALSTLDLNKRRAALGASSTLDVLRVEQEVQLARAQVVSADENLLRSREALGAALGSSRGHGVTPDVRLDALAADAQTVCRPERDIAKRSDVRAARAELAVAERRTGGIDWTFWPTIDAVSTLSVANVRGSNNEYLSWTVGGQLNWLLYDGGLRYGIREEREAAARIARETLTETQRRAELEVTQSQRAVHVTTANLAVSVRAREIAAETARLARVAFMNGSGTSFDLVDTARRLREAELDLAIKEFDLLRARVAALLALASCDV